MALVGRQGISGGGAYWTVTQVGDPDVLTMVFPERVATDATVPDVSLPEVVGQQAWTIDFDAVRAHMHPETSSHFPVWARSTQRLPRWDHRCASTLRRRWSGRHHDDSGTCIIIQPPTIPTAPRQIG